MKMPFGVHKGKEMDDVPATYLDWLRGQSWLNDWPLVAAYINEHSLSISAELGTDKEWDYL